MINIYDVFLWRLNMFSICISNVINQLTKKQARFTSTYFEGTQNFFAAYGYNRDGKKGKMQMCVGLLASSDGFPLRIQAFAGNASDSATVPGQINVKFNSMVKIA